MKIQKILLFSVLLPGVACANVVPVQGGKPVSPPVMVPPKYQPKIPSVDAPDLPQLGKMLGFGAESRYAMQAQSLQDQITILKLQSQVAALRLKLRKDAETGKPNLTSYAKSKGNYVSTVIGFHDHWRANLVLDGHGYWVQPGEETSLGRVFRINGSGVWLQTPQGRVLIGMRSDASSGNSLVVSSSPSSASSPRKKVFPTASSSVSRPATSVGVQKFPESPVLNP